MKEQFKQLLKPVIAKHYPVLADKPEAIERASDRIFDMLEDYRANYVSISRKLAEQNKIDYNQETCSGSIEYDYLFNQVSDIMFDQVSDIMSDHLKSSSDAALPLNMKAVDDIDDSVIDANYELASILDLVITSSAESMSDAIELCSLWRGYTIPQTYDVKLAEPIYVSDEEYQRRIAECQKALELCADQPGATISIKIEHPGVLRGDCYCTFYDHAAFVSALDHALFEFSEELH